MPPTSTKSAKSKTLETYDRVYDEAGEAAMDRVTIKLINASKKDLDAVALYLNLVLFRSGDLVNKKYLDPNACDKLVQENEALVELLFECIQEKSFVKLRNLVLFKPTKTSDAVEGVQVNFLELFERLSITVNSRSQFEREDVPRNNAEIYEHPVDPVEHPAMTIPNQPLAQRSSTQRGHATQPTTGPSSIPPDIQELQDTLTKLRIYSEATLSEERQLASSRYSEQFRLMFQPSDNEDEITVESDREYASLFWLHHSYLKDAVRAAAKGSSTAFKASAFCGSFIHPAAYYSLLDSEKLACGEDLSWGLPLFIQVSTNQVWLKYNPRSDWSVVMKGICPLIISDVASQKDKSNEYRMLLQAIAVSRVGNYLMKPTSDRNFFLVAIYLTDNLQARRYIVKPVSKERRAKVNIVKKTFDLKQPKTSTLFLLEMLNLLREIQSLAEHIDPRKKDELAALAQKAQYMLSFTTFQTAGGTSRTKTLDDILEDNEDNRPSHFNSSDVTEVLDEYDYEIGIVDCFHRNIALVFEKGTDNAVEILKFIEEGSNELRMIYHLATLKSPHNHAVRPIRMWSIGGGTMVSLPLAGQWISTSPNISKNLWDIVRQLFEAVEFLHDNNIAHLDLKPHNIMVSDTSGRLTIIDFGVSIQLKNKRQLIRGIVGTRGYIAPEVLTLDWYNPIRADLYSCGIVIKELCNKTEFSMFHTNLLAISTHLTDSDPRKRPMMSEALTWIDNISYEGVSETVPTVM